MSEWYAGNEHERAYGRGRFYGSGIDRHELIDRVRGSGQALTPGLDQVSGGYACFKNGAYRQHHLGNEEKAFASGAWVNRGSWCSRLGGKVCARVDGGRPPALGPVQHKGGVLFGGDGRGRAVGR